METENSPLLERMKGTVKAIEPAASVILFGSRARRSAGPESDWDLLILVDGPVDAARKRKLRHALYELEWETGEVITSVIKSREEWMTPRVRVSPFYLNVSKEGIML